MTDGTPIRRQDSGSASSGSGLSDNTGSEGFSGSAGSTGAGAVPECEGGRVGAECQFSDELTCNGYGAAQYDGTCVCMDQRMGPSCEHE